MPKSSQATGEVADQRPIQPNLRHVLQKQFSGTIFMVIDLKPGYHKIPLANESREKNVLD